MNIHNSSIYSGMVSLNPSPRLSHHDEIKETDELIRGGREYVVQFGLIMQILFLELIPVLVRSKLIILGKLLPRHYLPLSLFWFAQTDSQKVEYSTGKRSKEGALQDGINSAMRYIKNNFLDGPRQDAYDLVTGTWQPSRKGDVLGNSKEWFVDSRELGSRVAPWVALGSITILFFVVMFPGFMSRAFSLLVSLSLDCFEGGEERN